MEGQVKSRKLDALIARQVQLDVNLTGVIHEGEAREEVLN